MTKILNVGMIGAGFMAKAHSVAYAAMPMFFHPAPARINKKIIVDSNEVLAKEGKEKFDFELWSTDWRDIINDPEIDIVDVCVPNNIHYEIVMEAIKAKKHILCEKPMSITSEEAIQMYKAAKENNVKTMVAYNYRKTPAVLLAKKFIEAGDIGEILDFRGTYLQDWSADPNSPLSWRFDKNICGTGALGDIATHVIDIIRYLIGDFDEVNAHMNTYVKERPVQESSVDKLGTQIMDSSVKKESVTVDDYCNFSIKCKNGAFGVIEATRNAWGRKNHITFEIHGSKGSIYFDYENRDQIQVCFASDPADRRGFRTIITGPDHPYGEYLWPIPALGIGYTETKVIECYELVNGIVNGEKISPNFFDGCQIELICEAIIKSSKTSQWEKVELLSE